MTRIARCLQCFAHSVDNLAVEQLSRADEPAGSGDTPQLPLTPLLAATLIGAVLWWGIIDAVRWMFRSL